MFAKLFTAYGTLVVLAVFLVGWSVSRQVPEADPREITAALGSQAAAAADHVPQLLQDALDPALSEKTQRAVRELADRLGSQVSILDVDGTILADSEGSPSRKENQIRHAEIQEARAHQAGSSVRPRGPEGALWVHAARRVDIDGRPAGFFRISAPFEPVLRRVESLRKTIWRTASVVAAAALAVAALLAYRYSSRLQELSSTAHQIVRGDYDRTIDVSAEDELGTLARSFHQMRQELRQQIDGLERVRKDLQTMLETIPEAVLAIDSQQRILFANPSTYPLFGLPGGDIVGQRLWEVLRYPRLQELIDATFRSPGPYRSELEIHQPHRVLEFRGRSLTVKSGRAIIMVLHDISELRRLERLRQDFFTSVSHELKTPLASIKAFTETLLEDGVEDPATRIRFLKRIEEQADRLHTLVIDMLMLARVESEDHGFDVLPVDLHQSVREVVDFFAGEADARSVEVSFSLSPDARWVLADAEGIRTLLSNLVDNAIKYTPAKGRVLVSTARRDGVLLLVVEDTGVGIPQDDLRRIFERFYRVDKARSRELGGTGLGLSIVKHLAQRFGGSVAVTSRLGQGSTFSVTLPLFDRAGGISASPLSPSGVPATSMD